MSTWTSEASPGKRRAGGARLPSRFLRLKASNGAGSRRIDHLVGNLSQKNFNENNDVTNVTGFKTCWDFYFFFYLFSFPVFL
jgi:hypothetical protein